MTTYAARADIVERLTDRGIRWAADLDQGGSVSESENVATVDSQLAYASDLIDGYIAKLVDTAAIRAAGNDWLKGRCVDIAAWRVATTGGRTAPDVLRSDYDAAIALLEDVRDGQIVIPGYEPDIAGETCPIYVINPTQTRERRRPCRIR
ncbi:MAG: phage protein Gp36 family protein [Planctomycetota bacterium]